MKNFKVKANMSRYIYLGILGISFCMNLNHVFAQKRTRTVYDCHIDIEKNKSSISSEEVSIKDYFDFMLETKQEYGENSEQYKFLMPDTAKFKLWYCFSFPSGNKEERANCKTLKLYRNPYKTFDQVSRLPMIAISYEQALACCKWQEAIINRFSKSYTYQYSLPTKADYEMSLKKAKITTKEPLSILPNNHHVRNRIHGLTDNVAEYIQDGIIVLGGENTTLKFVDVKDVGDIPIGFRYKSVVISKKANTKK